MTFDNKAYGVAVRRARIQQGLQIGDIAAAFGVSEIEVSSIERGGQPSQKFTEAAAARLAVSYADFEIVEPIANNLDEAIDIVARENVLPFPYRYRVQDDV